MTSKARILLPWFVAAAISSLSCTALATPKAAEHEDAPVTMGADVVKPKPSAKSTKAAKKTRPAAKGKTLKNASKRK